MKLSAADDEALRVLEEAERAEARKNPLPRRQLGRGVTVLLVALRIYVLLAVPVVGYAFVHAMGK